MSRRTEVSQLVQPTRVRLWLVGLCLLALSNPANANHPDDSCPDIHVDNGQSFQTVIVNAGTWEEYANGAQIPVNTQLKATSRGTAVGYCTLREPSGPGICVTGATHTKDFVAINTVQITQNGQQNLQQNLATMFVPGSSRQQYDGVTEQFGATVANENNGGILTFQQTGSINDTICEVAPDPDTVTGAATIYLIPEQRCTSCCDLRTDQTSDGGNGNADVGNPCNAGTGNKHETETDYSAPGSGLSFVRSYNSLVPVDFGLGHGWISNFHKRLEKFGTSMRVRRGDGAGDVFTKSGSNWNGPADSVYKLTEDATGFSVTRRDGSIERYTLNGRIQYETDTVGRTTTYTYSTAGKLSSVTGPFGHVLSFTYNASGRLSTMVDPAQQVTIYSYDNNGNLTDVNYPDSSQRTYHYELTGYPFHALTGITDENGNRYSTFGYNSTSGKATLTQHAQTTNGQPQEKFTLVYNSATQTTVTDPAGNGEVLTFIDQHGMRKLTSRVSQVDGKGISQTFTANNNLDVYTDPEGRKTKYTYNATNQRASMIEAYQTPQARTTTYEYLSPSVDLVKKVITPSVKPGQQKDIITNYNANRTISSIVAQGYRPDGTPMSRTASMQYNSQGQVTQIDGPRTDVSDVSYIEYYECTVGSQCGQLSRITNALGHISTFDLYDAHGRLIQATDPNGLVTTYTYDLRGRVLTVTEGTRVTTLTYTDSGQLESVTQPNGHALTYSYDSAQDLRSITDNFGNKIAYTYDLRGNRKTEETRDPGNMLTRTITYTYDLRNRIDTINAASSITDLLFDAVGNLKQETDSNNHTTVHSFDPLNRITQTLDALSGVTTYSRDTQNHLTQVQAPNGAATTLSYDDLGNLLQHVSPDTGTISYTHDEAGNPISMTDARGVTVNYAYDALNRMTAVTYPTGSLNRAHSYDGGMNQKGRRTGMTDASGASAFTYTLHGELTGEGRTISGHSFSAGYGYDAAGQEIARTYPSSGRVVNYTRDALGRITTVTTTLAGATTPIASNIQYLPFGPVTSLTLGNGIVLGRLHDQQYRLDYLSDAGGSTTRDRTYAYDAAGNIDHITDNLVPSKTQVFAQDSLDRITSDSGSYGAVAYAHDSVGNRTQRSRTGVTEQTITYTANSNRLSSLNGSAFTYDSNGNTITDGPGNRNFTYDDTNRLVQVHVGGVLQATLAYNADGQRVRKTEAAGALRTFYFHYGQAGELIGEIIYNNVGQKLAEREYVWLEALPLAFLERTFDPGTGAVITNQVAYLHGDQLGTPRLATNAAQQVVWRWDSDAFGLGAAATDPDGDGTHATVGLRFPGHYWDAESGLLHSGARYYDSELGRFMSPDSFGAEKHVERQLERISNLASFQSLSGNMQPELVRLPFEFGSYTYVVNNPLRWIDPSGESLVGPIVIVGGGCLTFYCIIKARNHCLYKFPSSEGPISDRKRQKCFSEYMAYCVLLGFYVMDPLGSGSSTIGHEIGKEMCDSCE